MGPVVDVLAAIALLAGGLLSVVAGIGMVRLPDVAARLQAATKPQVVGLLLICVGVAPYIAPMHALALALVALFQLTTAPVLAQLIGRAAYRSGAGRGALLRDDLQDPPGG
ncbi:MAG TPA: monovalent cation/H(+) antiporter subunit G [Nocardioidaceae bacterium]|nr:monovalent cation/H(+) antiporter subunit G [Nocardioidaceae bacterium]